VFAHACSLWLEGIVSKRRDFPYRSGRVKSWIKTKNPASPAMLRIQGAWGGGKLAAQWAEAVSREDL
jgi:ATP-dependent DNA ligase